jgi:hypothetical protein
VDFLLNFVVIFVCDVLNPLLNFTTQEETHGQTRGVYTVGRYFILLERSRKAGFFVVNFVVFVLGVF